MAISPLRCNPVAAASRLNRRGRGYEPLFKRGALGDEPVALYNKHDELTRQFVKVSEHDSPEPYRQAGRALFEEQERKQNKLGGQTIRTSAGPSSDMFRRTRSAPESPLSSPSKPGRGPGQEKDSIRPDQREGHSRVLQRRHTAAAGSRKKTAQEIYNEMAMPWLSKLGESSQQASQFSDDSSQASPVEGFIRTRSVPSPQKGQDEAACADKSGFVRTQSAPSGCNEDFSRLSSTASASTNGSSEAHVQELLIDAAGTFTRVASAPASGPMPSQTEFTSENVQALRSARSVGNPPRAFKKPLQSAEEAAEELFGKGLNAEWIEENVMPFCVAEQLADRLNWDDEFRDLFPGKPSASGIFTPKKIQTDFAEFLERRDVMCINIPTEMQAQSASHVLRFFTTNEGHQMLRKKGGSVCQVLDGGFAMQDQSLTTSVRGLVGTCSESCRVVYLKNKGVSQLGGISLVENALFPFDELADKYEVFSPSTAGFYVFRHLHGKMGGNFMYRNVKYEHYCGWVMVHRADKRSRTSYKVQYVSAFRASLIKQNLMNLVPRSMRPRKSLMATLIYYLLYSKADR